MLCLAQAVLKGLRFSRKATVVPGSDACLLIVDGLLGLCSTVGAPWVDAACIPVPDFSGGSDSGALLVDAACVPVPDSSDGSDGGASIPRAPPEWDTPRATPITPDTAVPSLDMGCQCFCDYLCHDVSSGPLLFYCACRTAAGLSHVSSFWQQKIDALHLEGALFQGRFEVHG